MATSDEQRYKYMHGGKYGDRDLYLIREEKYGADPNYEERRYRPGYRNNVDENLHYNHNRPGRVHESRVTQPVGYYDNVAIERRIPEIERHDYHTRDSLTSYGASNSPKGGIRGIEYDDEYKLHGGDYYDDYGVSKSYGQSNLGMRRSKSGKKKWTPLCDIGETDKHWVIRCEIPGVKKDKLSVEIEGKDLIIRGKRIKELWNSDRLSGSHSGSSTNSSSTTVVKTSESGVVSKEQTTEGGVTSGATVTEKKNPDGTITTTRVAWVDKERGGRGTFKRKIRLPARVEQSAVQALYKDGILEVMVKKPETIEKKKKHNRVSVN